MYSLFLNLAQRTKQAADNTSSARIYIETTYANPLMGAPTNGRPVVILLPGGPGGGMDIYKNHSQQLAEFANLIYWDPRGCGKSDKSPLAEYNMDTYIDDVNAIRAALHLNQFVVLGTSYGSMAALGFALRYPEYTQALILGSPVASSEFIQYAQRNLELQANSEQKRQGEKLLAGRVKSEQEVIEYFQIMASLYSDSAKNTDLDKSYFNMPTGVYNWRALIEAFKSPDGFLHNFDFRKQLHTISCPVLIMTGEHDWINDLELVKDVAKSIGANAVIKIFPCGHSIAVDCNAAYIASIRDFLRQHPIEI